MSVSAFGHADAPPDAGPFQQAEQHERVERDEGGERRYIALQLAMDLHKGISVDSQKVLDAATLFEAYLKGC